MKSFRQSLSTSSFSIRECILVLLLIAISIQIFETRASTPDDGLKRGAEKFVATVESKNPSALLVLFSEQGTSFISSSYALPKASYTPREIRASFENRTEVYCLFFDTTCLREADLKRRQQQTARPIRIPLKSVADLVAAAKQRKFVTYGISASNGKVTLLLSDRTPDTAKLGEDALNFYFRQESGQWKLRNIEFQ